MKWFITACYLLFFYIGTAQNSHINLFYRVGYIVDAGKGDNINYTVSTLAGSGIAGNVNDSGAEAFLNYPKSVAVDGIGNIYVADAANNIIRKITPDGAVTNYAGTGVSGSIDGPAGKASFYFPSGIAVDKQNNIYVADKGNHKIRKISPAGMVTTLAGSGMRGDAEGTGNKACFNKPVSVAVDDQGYVFVADQFNQKIRKISPIGEVKTLAGSGHLGYKDGKGSEASFYDPAGVAVDKLGNVYVADYSNNCIRKISGDGIVTTVSGSNTIGSNDGIAQKATFYFPDAVAVDGAGNLYISDQVNNKIRMLTPLGEVQTIAGTGNSGSVDGQGQFASFNNPAGVAVDVSGYLYVADYNNHKVRKIIRAAKASAVQSKL